MTERLTAEDGDSGDGVFVAEVVKVVVTPIVSVIVCWTNKFSWMLCVVRERVCKSSIAIVQ